MATTRPAIEQYASLLLKLHRLIRTGEGEGREAEKLRDAMDEPWSRLSTAEEADVRALSVDLHGIRVAPSAGRQPANEAETGLLRRLKQLVDAKEKDWREVLTLLREGAPLLDQHALSYFRGRGWDSLDLPEVAVEFFEDATRLAPQKWEYRAHALESFGRADNFGIAAFERASSVLSEQGAHPHLRLKAATTLFRHATKLKEPAKTLPIFRTIADNLRDVLRLTKGQSATAVDKAGRLALLQLLGAVLDHLDDDAGALAAYEEATKLAPENPLPQIARGLFLYGRSRTTEGVRDLEGAVAARTASGAPRSAMVWPFLLLAHHRVVSKRYQEALTFVEHGLKTPQVSPLVAATLFSWGAIARAELRYSPAAVREYFGKALELAPGSARIEHNRVEFERVLAQQRRKEPERWETEDVTTIRDYARLFSYEESEALSAAP